MNISKKTAITIIILCGLLSVLAGCNSLHPRTITLKLAGFPIWFDSWDVKVLAYQGVELKATYNFENIDPNIAIEKSITAEAGVDNLEVLLTASKNKDGDPTYIGTITLSPGVNTYENLYWVYYSNYINRGEKFYGISQYMAKEINPNTTEELDFTRAPYYLFKLTSVKDRDLSVEVSSRNGVYMKYCANLLQGEKYSQSDSKFIISRWENDVLYILFQTNPVDVPKLTVNIRMLNSDTLTEGYPFKILPADSPNKLIAVMPYVGLDIIDPFQQSPIQKYQVNMEMPEQVTYNPNDKKVYICQQGKSEILIIDPATGASTIQGFDEEVFAVQFNPVRHRMYVVKYHSDLRPTRVLLVIDTDTGKVISDTIINGTKIAVNEETGDLYSWTMENGKAQYLYRYEFENDIPIEKEEQQIASTPKEVEFSADGSLVVNVDLNTLLLRDSTNLNKIKGDLTLASRPKSMVFSPDGSLLYVVSSDQYDNYIHVIATQTVTEVRKIPFVNMPGGSDLSINSDGTKLATSWQNIVSYWDVD